MTPALLDEIDGYRQHFDAMYVGGIPHLMNEDGAYLAFLAIVSATDALAGLFAPSKGTGERFRAFVETYFPPNHRPHAERLWELRNGIVHSFNPGPFFALTYHASRHHLKSPVGINTLGNSGSGLDSCGGSFMRGAVASPEDWNRQEARPDTGLRPDPEPCVGQFTIC